MAVYQEEKPAVSPVTDGDCCLGARERILQSCAGRSQLSRGPCVSTSVPSSATFCPAQAPRTFSAAALLSWLTQVAHIKLAVC